MQAHEMLKAARIQTGLNQDEAAAQCGVSFSAYEKWERGAKIMPPVMAGLMLILGAGPVDALKAAEKVKKASQR